jgi:hypothetical protein
VPDVRASKPAFRGLTIGWNETWAVRPVRGSNFRPKLVKQLEALAYRRPPLLSHLGPLTQTRGFLLGSCQLALKR